MGAERGLLGSLNYCPFGPAIGTAIDGGTPQFSPYNIAGT